MKIYVVIVGIDILGNKFFLNKEDAIKAIIEDVESTGEEFDDGYLKFIKENDYYYHNEARLCAEYIIKGVQGDLIERTPP